MLYHYLVHICFKDGHTSLDDNHNGPFMLVPCNNPSCSIIFTLKNHDSPNYQHDFQAHGTDDDDVIWMINSWQGCSLANRKDNKLAEEVRRCLHGFLGIERMNHHIRVMPVYPTLQVHLKSVVWLQTFTA